MTDDDVNELIARWRLNIARQERIQRVFLISLVIAASVAFGLLVATMRL